MNRINLTMLTGLFAAALPGVFAQSNTITVQLRPDPTMVACLSDGSPYQPTATATVVRGAQNDVLILNASHLKPGLAFDVFTVERSRLVSNGGLDPAFHGFGMAWYQSDLQTGPKGNAHAQIQTILLDQIFGFDPDVNLTPKNTFHVGFWFNNPQDAAACGFNVNSPTPFNGEHRAGPVAMISLPNAQTNLGPLCTNPDTSTNPASCHP